MLYVAERKAIRRRLRQIPGVHKIELNLRSRFPVIFRCRIYCYEDFDTPEMFSEFANPVWEVMKQIYAEGEYRLWCCLYDSKGTRRAG